MYTKPNQRVVINTEEQPKIDKANVDPKKFVVSRTRGNEEAAMRDLKYGAFKLWLWFSADAKGFKRAFSPTHAEQELGISQPTARSGFKELIEKGYLVQKENGNTYEFHQVPPKKIKIKLPRRRIIDEDGVIFELTYEELCEELKGYSKETIEEVWNSGEVI